MSKKIIKRYEAWRKKLKNSAAERHETPSGIPVEPLYVSRMNAEQRDESLGLPGEFPYTRGIHAQMYRERPWTMRQYAGFSTAKQTNERFKFLLKSGVSGLSVAFDLPTQMGRDSDHALAEGEVGRVGVAIDTIEDMRILFDGIDLSKISVSMTINSTASILLAFYLALADERGIPWSSLRGTVQNDLLKEYIARGTYIYPVEPALRIVTDVFEFCSKEVPKWNTISVSGYHIREAGADAAQELAFTLLNAKTYVKQAVSRGMSVEEFAPRMSFFFNCHNNFLEEVSKFRAARRMWAKILLEEFDCKDIRSQKMRFHTQTAGSTLIAQQPMTNVVRTSFQALAAVLGGTQSLHTNGYDEAISLPSEEAALLALRTQQILLEESGVADFVDPLGGSYAVEQLTDQLEARANQLILKVEQDFGGMPAAIEAEFPQDRIADRAYDFQRALESGERRVVGLNCALDGISSEEVVAEETSRDSALISKEQISRLTAYKANRQQEKVAGLLEKLTQQAEMKANLMPVLIESVKEGLSLGEISDCLRDVFGEYR